MIFPSELAAIILLEFNSKALTFRIESKKEHFHVLMKKLNLHFYYKKKLRKINDNKKKKSNLIRTV